MQKRKIIIDTDPGIDDAVALAIALHAEELEVKLITTVNGNVSLDKVTLNTLKLLTFFDKEVPVAKGASAPLLNPVQDASDIHGNSGLDGYQFDEPTEKMLLEEHGVIAMHQLLQRESEKLTIVAIGPLTNIALLLTMFPADAAKINELVIMGGSTGRGNFGVLSEFNIGSDPEAAKIVLNSGIAITIVPLEVGDQARLLPEDSLRIKDLNKTGEMLYQLFVNYRSGSLATGLSMYDSCALAYVLEPTLFTVVETFVDIELAEGFTRGAMVVDLNHYLNKKANAKICINLNVSQFKGWLLNCLANAY